MKGAKALGKQSHFTRRQSYIEDIHDCVELESDDYIIGLWLISLLTLTDYDDYFLDSKV